MTDSTQKRDNAVIVTAQIKTAIIEEFGDSTHWEGSHATDLKFVIKKGKTFAFHLEYNYEFNMLELKNKLGNKILTLNLSDSVVGEKTTTQLIEAIKENTKLT